MQRYSQLRTATGRLLNHIRQIGGHVVYSGERKTASTSRHQSAERFKHQLLRIVRRADRFFSARQATFMLLVDEQQAGGSWREMNVKVCTLAMFEDAAHRCRTLIEPLIQGESHLFQTLQCADWICGLVGRLCAYEAASSQYRDWEIFHRYFHARLQAVALPCSGLERCERPAMPAGSQPSV